MTADLGFVDVHESSRAQLLKRSIEQAELNASSCIVRHAEVVWESAADRRRRELSEDQARRVVPLHERRRA